jgi:acetolactate synthase-1/2/3 large subunit
MILFVGDVGSDFRDREAFQEVDFSAMFAPLAKWAARIDSVERIPEYIARAWRVAMSGRRGPVVLALPEDMLAREAEVGDAMPVQAPEANPAPADLARLRELLAGARRPFVIIGGSGWSAEACADLRRFVEANDLPCGCAFRFQDLLDNRHPNYAGDVGVGVNPALAARVRSADVLLVIGARLGEMTTSGYTLLDVPVPKQKLVHVHPAAEELGRVFHPELAIVSAMGPFLRGLAALAPIASPPWTAETKRARAELEAWQAPREMPGRVQLCEVVAHLDRVMPPDTIYANGAGNYAVWLHRFHRYTGFRTQVAPTSGAVGYSVPAAVAAKIAAPDRAVVCWSGDGCFLMHGTELATAMQYGAAVIFIVVNNGMYATIRMHQEKHYPGRVVGTDLVNPDFAAFARAFGAHGEVVEETSQFALALERSLASGKSAVIELRVDPQAITPNTTIDALRAAKQ